MIKRTNLIFFFKAILSITILLFLLSNIDFFKVRQTLKNANTILILTVVALNIFERFQLTYKWNLLIKVRGVAVAFGRLFWINSIGSYLGLFLPSSLGTDVVRGYYLVKNNSENIISISSVFVDRILGMFSLLTLGLVSVFFAGPIVSQYNIQIYIIVIFTIAALSFYLLQMKQSTNVLNAILKKFKNKKIIENGLKLHSSVIEYRSYPKTLTISFIITLMVQVTRVLTYYFIALAFDINISPVYYFLFVPIIMIVIMIPISIGGLGVKEGTFVAFFTLAGMSVNDAVIISFMNSLIDMLNTVILGGGGYLFYKSPLKENIYSTNT